MRERCRARARRSYAAPTMSDTLILLPGLVSDRAVWRPQCEALAPRAHCHVPDWGLLDSLGAMAEHRNRVAGLAERQIDREVGRGAGVGLDVGVLGAEQRLGAGDAQLLNLVDELLTLVVATAGIAFAVLVRQRRAERFEDRRRGVVFTRDEANLVSLALVFLFEERENLRVDAAESIAKHAHI